MYSPFTSQSKYIRSHTSCRSPELGLENAVGNRIVLDLSHIHPAYIFLRAFHSI